MTFVVISCAQTHTLQHEEMRKSKVFGGPELHNFWVNEWGGSRSHPGLNK